MARILRMPSTSELPPGPRRDFVEEMFHYYRAAGRPPLREVGDRLAARDDLAGTASRETIRRMLLGITVPTRWPTVESVFRVLCEMASLNPNARRFYDDDITRFGKMAELWNEALDAGPLKGATDPWAEALPRSTLWEDPPF